MNILIYSIGKVNQALVGCSGSQQLNYPSDSRIRNPAV